HSSRSLRIQEKDKLTLGLAFKVLLTEDCSRTLRDVRCWYKGVPTRGKAWCATFDTRTNVPRCAHGWPMVVRSNNPAHQQKQSNNHTGNHIDESHLCSYSCAR